MACGIDLTVPEQRLVASLLPNLTAHPRGEFFCIGISTPLQETDRDRLMASIWMKMKNATERNLLKCPARSENERQLQAKAFMLMNYLDSDDLPSKVFTPRQVTTLLKTVRKFSSHL